MQNLPFRKSFYTVASFPPARQRGDLAVAPFFETIVSLYAQFLIWIWTLTLIVSPPMLKVLVM